MPTNSLYDATIRQQIYLEGVKNAEKDRLLSEREIIIALAIAILTRVAGGVENMGDLTKRQLSKFRSEFDKAVKPLLKKSGNKLYKFIREFLGADFILTRQVYSVISGTGVTFGAARNLWRTFVNELVPGVGMTPAQMIGSFLSHSATEFNKRINIAYADKLSVAEFTASIKGTKALKHKDGLFNKLNNQFNTLMFTLLQKARNTTSAYVGSLYYEYYEWVSVLDSVTTYTCRKRNGKRYKYGEGPVPPAHWNCRSSIVPATAPNDDSALLPKPGIKARPTPLAPIPADENSFYKWLQRQPLLVQEDIVGKSWARALHNNKLSPKQLAGFDTVKKLTIDGYRLKADLILAE